VTGPRPLVLAAHTISIDSVLDVASHSMPATKVGPAANSSLCKPPIVAAQNNNNLLATAVTSP
jgi:hypothetical protein